MLIRDEESRDFAAVREINTLAFETASEANLVEVLRKEAHPILSLVAEEKGVPVGHILFTQVTLTGHAKLKIMGLGPMAVSPDHQRNGIGSELVQEGFERCKELGFGAAVVLGHTWFYPRFGFIPAGRYGIRSEYDVPEEAFMIIELKPGYLAGASGTIQYHQAFNSV